MGKEVRIGKITISSYLIEDENFHKILHELEFVPVRVEHCYAIDAFEYIGISPKFDEIEPGLETPEYQIIIHTENGVDSVEEIKRVTDG